MYFAVCTSFSFNFSFQNKKNLKKPVAWSFLRDLTRNRQENNFAWPYEFGNAFAIGNMIDFHLGLTGTCI